MCNLTDNFMEDQLLDAEYQEWLYRKQQEKLAAWDELLQIEQHAYDLMCEQAYKEQQQYEILMMEKEYRKIEEWEELQTV
jgi:hypothetical protein